VTTAEVIALCDKAINSPDKTEILLVMPGVWDKTDRRKLCRNGPTGRIIADNVAGQRVVVRFDAIEVKQFLEQEFLPIERQEDISAPQTFTELISLKGASKILGVSTQTVINWTNRGIIPGYQIGPRGHWRFKPSAMWGYIESRIAAEEER